METPNRTTLKKKYDEAFKRAAVDMLINSGKKAKQIAGELGVSTWNLRDWKKVYGPKTAVVRRSTSELEAENNELRQELMRVKTQRDILKKTLGILSTPRRQRYQRMKALAGEFTLKDLCEAFGVSRSGYYAWLGNDRTPRARNNQELAAEIRKLFAANDGNYGSPRMTQALHQQRKHCNRKRVERLMREEGLSARRKKRFKVQTTDSNHDHPVAPNLLPQKSATRPNEVWVVDVTYIRTGEGWLYLAGVMDLYSRRIIDWSMKDHMETSLVLDALGMGLQQRQPGHGLLHHSDRGVQYASQAYRETLRSFGLEASMSRKGNCYDNATMESFWGTLKTELVYRTDYPTRDDAKRSIFAWIETYYNRKRIHSSLGYKSPVDFENQLN